MPIPQVIASAGFDDITSRDLRFLQEASTLGELTVLLWTDELLQRATGTPPKFPFAERSYFLNAVRFVSRVVEHHGSRDSLPPDLPVDLWADYALTTNPAREQFARDNGAVYQIFSDAKLQNLPEVSPSSPTPEAKKVIVTGCYDWLHSGHVRFFEEVSSYGDLYVVVGHDANIRLLKGAGHPLQSQQERRYAVSAIRHVKQALISSGEGWLDADPEIRRLQPDMYIVNEDGDAGGKREYCASLGIEYRVLKRAPAPGLPPRTSTALRGF